MSIRHQGLRDTYFNKLNLLISDACLRWQQSTSNYNVNDPLRFDYFLEHVLEISGRPFWRNARRGSKDLDQASLTSQAEFDKFCDRIKPFASDEALRDFRDFVANTFITPELAWNHERRIFRHLNEVFEHLGLKRTKRWRLIASDDYAQTVADHVEHLYFSNRVREAVDIGTLYMEALSLLQRRDLRVTDPSVAAYVTAFAIPVILNNVGVEVPHPPAVAPWVTHHQAVLDANRVIASLCTSSEARKETQRTFDDAVLFMTMHQYASTNLPSHYHNPLFDWYPFADDRARLIDMGRTRFGYALDYPLGLGNEVPHPHPRLGQMMRLTKIALKGRREAVDVESLLTVNIDLHHDSRFAKQIRDNNAPFRSEDLAQLNIGLSSACIWYFKSKQTEHAATWLDNAITLLQDSRSYIATAEFYSGLAHFMNCVGNAALEARAWRKAAALYGMAQQKDKRTGLEIEADMREDTPLQPNLPADLELYLKFARLLKRKGLLLYDGLSAP